MAKAFQLRDQLYDEDQQQLGQHARDVQDVFKKIPVIEHRTLDALYSEPLTLGQLTEEPFCIELVRVINLVTPETPKQCGGMCHFTWKPLNGGALIANIDGLSTVVDGATKFRFYFRITYRME